MEGKQKAYFILSLELIREVLIRKKGIEKFSQLLDCFASQNRRVS